MTRNRNYKKNQMQILNMKNVTSEMQLSLNEIKSRLDIEKEKIIEPEGLTMKQKKTHPCPLSWCFSFPIFLV